MDYVHCIDIIHFSTRDMEECWYLSLNVVEGMYFDTTLMFAKPCPPEYVQTQVYRSRVECIDIAI